MSSKKNGNQRRSSRDPDGTAINEVVVPTDALIQSTNNYNYLPQFKDQTQTVIHESGNATTSDNALPGFKNQVAGDEPDGGYCAEPESTTPQQNPDCLYFNDQKQASPGSSGPLPIINAVALDANEPFTLDKPNAPQAPLNPQPTCLLNSDGKAEDVGGLPEDSLYSRPAMNQTPYVFLSHTGKDDNYNIKRCIAHPTHWFLTEILKVEAFLDEENATGNIGEDKHWFLLDNAYKSTHAVVILSPRFIARRYCVMELNTFMERHLQEDDSFKVLPFLYGLPNLKGYSKSLQNLVYHGGNHGYCVNFMVKSLWPELSKQLGFQEKTRMEYEHLIVQYVHDHRGDHDIPADLEDFAKKQPVPLNHLCKRGMGIWSMKILGVAIFVAASIFISLGLVLRNAANSDTDGFQATPSPLPAQPPTARPTTRPTLQPALTNPPTPQSTTGGPKLQPTPTPTPRPTPQQTLRPTTRPTPQPVTGSSPPQGLTVKAFETTAELYQAVDKYMEDPTLTAEYGATMNDWDVSRIQVFDRLFDGSRNQAGYETRWCEQCGTCSSCNQMLFNEDLNKWNTSNAVSMNAMFIHASEFNGDISTWDVSRVASMESLFENARAFNRALSQWNTRSVTSMQETFSYAYAFNQPIGNWNVARVTTTHYMFSFATSFNQPIGNWNVASVTTTSSMFESATSFNQDLSAWDVGAVTDAYAMFWNANALNQDLCAWRTKLPTTAEVFLMFRSTDACPVDTSVPNGIGQTPVLGETGQYWCHQCNINTFFATTAELYQAVDKYMEDPALTAEYGATMNDWDVSRIQVFDRVFDGSRNQAGYETSWCKGDFCTQMLFNEDLNKWNTSNAVSMNAMFTNAREFNGDISTWDVSRVASIESLFENARAFNRDLSQWNTGSVTSMPEVFQFASAFNQPIGNWNVGRVTITRSMFNWATSFNQDLSAWDVGAVTDAYAMFWNADALNQDLCAWRTKLPSTANVDVMFADADACPVDTSFSNGVGSTPVLGVAGQYWCHECTV